MWFVHLIFLLFSSSLVFGEDCYTHDFGENFNDVFTAASGVCGVMRPWIQLNYNSTNIESFHPNSESFVTPQTVYSCILSEVFPMAGGGTLELNTYMQPRSSTDEIRLLAYQHSSNTIIGQISSSLSQPNFIWGWNTLSLTLAGSDSYDGYVVIVGRKQSNSDVLVDSLRYIPASSETEDECHIYEDEEEEVVYACIEYDFENYYETIFNNLYSLCLLFAKWETITNVQGSFISPNEAGDFSCTSSLFFKLEDNGTLELNVVGESMTNSDFITIMVLDEQSIQINEETHYMPSDIDNFVPGPNTLKIPINVNEPKNVQIIFLGVATAGSTVLIDSFKFIPSSWNRETCVQFKDVVIED